MDKQSKDKIRMEGPDLHDEGVLLTLDKEEVRSQVTVHVPGLSVHAQTCTRYR
jgi:hypothetical protein